MAGFLGLDELFEGRHFDREVIVLCVRWYLRFKLSYRDLAEMMAERGLSIVHTTIMRRVHRYVPEFERRWNRFARPVGRSWRVDEGIVMLTSLKRPEATSGYVVPITQHAERMSPAARC
jgi:transposase-like protein